MTLAVCFGGLIANHALGFDMLGLQGGSERDTKRSRHCEFGMLDR